MTRGIRLLALALVLALPGVASGAEIKGVDTSNYPEVRFTVETAEPGTTAPTVTENGLAVAGLEAENMGRALSVVLAVDRSVSMKGEPLTNAVAAARAFVAAKPAADRIAVATFATNPVMLTDFSTSTIDADDALGSLVVDSVQGTTLYDALVMASGSLDAEPLPARAIIVVTDGNETRSEATLDDAIAAAQDAGVSVYVIAIESEKFTPAPLRDLAASTGGSYYGAASPEALAGVYESIAQELKRTWQVRYFTASRPGTELVARGRGRRRYGRRVVRAAGIGRRRHGEAGVRASVHVPPGLVGRGRSRARGHDARARRRPPRVVGSARQAPSRPDRAAHGREGAQRRAPGRARPARGRRGTLPGHRADVRAPALLEAASRT